MKIVIPKIDFYLSESKPIYKDYYYVFPNFIVDKITKEAYNNGLYIPFKSIIDFEHILEKYDYNKHKNEKPNIIIVRTGGFGDVIAISSLMRYLFDNDLVNNIIFYTEKKEVVKYFPFYDNLINKRFFVADFSIPLNRFNFLFNINGEIDQDNVKYIIFEGVIEKDKENNWYDLFFSLAGFNPDDIGLLYKRPVLKDYDNNYNWIREIFDNKNKIVCLTLSSTSYIRRMSYYRIIKHLIDIGLNVICFLNHLTDYDKYLLKEEIVYNKSLIRKHFNRKLYIINFPLSFDEYYNIISQSDLTISVDTVTTHIREGIEKPSINIYVPFPSWARSKYYIYTRNIDFKSSCPYQPCFIHTKKSTEKCKYFKEAIKKHNDNKKFIEKVQFFPPCMIETEDKILSYIDEYLIRFNEN